MPFPWPPPAPGFEVELPGVFLDDVVEDQANYDAPVLINRDPEPGETSVPVSTLIKLDIARAASIGDIDITFTQVFVEGILAWDGAGFKPGFSGPGSMAFNPQVDVLRIIIDYQNQFESEQEVEVHVIAYNTNGGQHLDETYSFTCADITQPILVSVEASALSRLRVTFDEAVVQVDAAGATDALNPANWELERLSAPAVTAAVATVETVSDMVVDVFTDVPLTPGGTYTLYANNIFDTDGNEIAAPFNQKTFTAFAPPVPLGRNWQLLKMLPLINRQEDETTQDLRKFIACLQEVTDLLLFDIDSFLDILDPDLAPEQYVDLMLLDLGNPFEFDLDLVNKRRLVQVLVEMYKLKGTAVGIKEVLLFFMGLVVDIDAYNTADVLILGESELGEDWILSPSSSFLRFSFRVITDQVLTETQRKQLTSVVNYMKPAHTHFVELVEPTVPDILDHLELGLSELGESWYLH